MAERANEVMKTWGGIILAVIQLVIVVFAGPWMWKITNAVERLSGDMQENRAWHANQTEAMAREKENLRLQVMADVEKMTRALLERSEAKQDRITDEVRTTDKTVRDTAAQIGVLNSAISSLTATVNRMQADVRQALIDMDFQRSAQPKGN